MTPLNRRALCNISFPTAVTNETLLCGNNTSGTPSSLPEDGLFKDQADTTIFVLECVVFPVVTVFGVAGNVLSLIVLCNKRILNAHAVLLVGLAITDTLFLIANILRKSQCIVDRLGTAMSGNFYVYSFSTIFYIKTATSRASTWLVVAISAERFLAVTFPLKVKFLVTKTRMTAVVLSVSAITFALFAVFPATTVVKYRNGRPFVGLSRFYEDNADAVDAYTDYALPVLFRWIPQGLVIILNGLICATILRKDRRRMALRITHRSSRQQRDQKRLTTMLLILATVFVVCLLPGDAFIIATSVIPEFNNRLRYRYLYRTLSDVSLLFEMINSSVNFLIYMASNSTFSALYIAILCPCIRRPAGSRSHLEHSPSSLSRSGSTCETGHQTKEETMSHCGGSTISVCTVSRASFTKI